MGRSMLRWLALLAALLVASPSVVSARPHYFCHAMERVLPACCCETGERHDENGASARAADCCERLSASKHAGLALQLDTVDRVGAPALLATVPAVEFPARRASECTPPVPNAQGPPPQRVPLFLKNCSLLT